MVSLRKLMPAVALIAGSYVSGSISHAEDMDMKKVMEEIRAIKAQNADLQRQVASMKSGETKKASAEVAVDKALKKACDDGFYHDCELHPRKIKIGGLVDFSYQYNLNQPGERFNTLRAFDNYQSNDFALNLANVYFDGTAKEKGDAGFMIDLGFGRDANTAYGLGYDNVLQAYINYIAPIGKGVEMTVGKFYTPIGFEVAKGDNWNITRSMNFAWTQPLSHTGGQLGYQLLDAWSLKAGVVNSYFNRTAQDNNDDKTFYVSNTWKPLKNLSWSVTGMIGNEETRQSSLNSNAAPGNIYGSGVSATQGAFGIPGASAAGTANSSGAFSPAAASPYGDIAPPTYADGFGASRGLRGSDSSMTYTVNSVLTYDPMETLHFGFEFNWQMKEGYDYKADDLITDPSGTFSTAFVPRIPANASYASAVQATAFNNVFIGTTAPVGSDGLTTAQSQALWNYYHGDRSNAVTWGAAGYVKWDFQKNWYVALRGEYIDDQSNLAFRNDAGVIAQTNYLNAAKASLFPNVSYANPLPAGVTNASAGAGSTGGTVTSYTTAGSTAATAAGIYGPITPGQYNEMIKKLDHRSNDAWSVTGTVGWNITKALKWKLEYRHDQASKDVFYGKGSHQTNVLPPTQNYASDAAGVPVTNGALIKAGYVPTTSNHQDTVSMQFQYSF